MFFISLFTFVYIPAVPCARVYIIYSVRGWLGFVNKRHGAYPPAKNTPPKNPKQDLVNTQIITIYVHN